MRRAYCILREYGRIPTGREAVRPDPTRRTLKREARNARGSLYIGIWYQVPGSYLENKNMIRTALRGGVRHAVSWSSRRGASSTVASSSTIEQPTALQLRRHALTMAVPMVGFGVKLNGIELAC